MKVKLFSIFILFLLSCTSEYTPKPRAFSKIDLPNKIYEPIMVNCPFQFQKPNYSKVKLINDNCFINLTFPNQNAILHITYFKLEDNLLEHTEESRRLAYKHNVMADAIIEKVYLDKNHNVYGVLYDYDGFTATAAQFYLTDSINHFFRGALYFSTEVTDSLLPVNNFLKKDVVEIIESFRWKDLH